MQELEMTVRKHNDILRLAHDQRMGDGERRARRTLFELGSAYVPLDAGTKKRGWTGRHYIKVLLGGDAHVTVPPGHVLIDPDSPLGQALVAELELPPTLTLGGRRGVRLLFRLPRGVVLQKKLRLLTDVDIITDYFVAPGSVVEGTYFRVVEEREIAELPMTIALGMKELIEKELILAVQADRTFTVVDDVAEMKAKAAENRRTKAKAARWGWSASAPAKAMTGDSLQCRATWLAEDRDGQRHQALWRLAWQMLGRGESYEAFEALVRAHPVSSKLQGQSKDWLRHQVWDRAERKFNAQSSTRMKSEQLGGSRWIRRWREYTAVSAANKWLAHVRRVVARSGLDEDMQVSLVQLCELQADYAVRYGIYGGLNRVDASGVCCYFLAYSLMRKHLNDCGGDAITRRLGYLVKLGLLVIRTRAGLIREQATYYQLVISGRSALPPAAGTHPLSWPLTCGDTTSDDGVSRSGQEPRSQAAEHLNASHGALLYSGRAGP
jgi:hypothetical protein